MRPTPHIARVYLLAAAFLLALPTLASFYKGHTGKLLVAAYSTGASGGPFERSVIYLVHHDLWSAHGYILNRPLDKGERVPSSPYRELYGGPVAEGTPVALMGRDAQDDILFLSSDAAADELENISLLYGYAGWGPVQLNYEIMRGHWSVMDYDPEIVFETPSGAMWQQARDRFLEQSPVVDDKIL